MRQYSNILSVFLSLCTFSSPVLAMESPIFEDPEFMKSSFRASALQPRTQPFERLEFLGDRVLNLVAAHMLYKHPYFKEGDVGEIALDYAFLVSKSTLVEMYNDLHIAPSQLSSPFYCAPEHGHIAEKTASDIVEALMGALYRERGFEKAQESLEKFIEKYCSLKNKKPLKKTKKAPQSTLSLIRMWFPSSKNFDALQEALEYQFKNQYFLHDAFHHPSAGGETPYKKLGFLGVRVLGLIIADYVFNKEQEHSAGTLSQNFDRMIGNKSLEQIFQKWHLGKYLERQHETIKTVRKKGGGGTGISTGMAADTIRTLVSSVYLDGGWTSAHSIVHKLFFSEPSSQFLEANPYATIKAEAKKEDFTEDSYGEIKEEDFGGFSNEDCLELPAEFNLEEQIDRNNPQELWPSLKTNEQTTSKNESIWNRVNNSSVKISNDQSKDLALRDKIESKAPIPHQSALAHRLSLRNVNVNKPAIKEPALSVKAAQNPHKSIMDRNEHKIPSPQREIWPGLAQGEQPPENKDSIWNNINASTIKKPLPQTKNIQNASPRLNEENEETICSPPQELWPALSHSSPARECSINCVMG